MADRVSKVSYVYFTVPNRTGRGARILDEVRRSGINLLAFSGFPAGGGKAQLDLVVESPARIRAIARQHGWSLSKPKKGFLVQGADHVGAVNRHLQRLAGAGIGVTACDAVSAGKGRYGMILWVRPRDYGRAARELKAT